MATTDLKAEIQLRINALTAPTPAEEILQNAVDTVGLDLDLTNIISVLNSATALVDSGTSDNDVTALNAASIALGVTSKPVAEVGVSFQSEGIVNEDIAVGQTGNLISVPAVAEKVYRILVLTTTSNSEQVGISLTVNGNIIANQLTLISQSGQTFAANRFGVSSKNPDFTTYKRGVYTVIECSSFSLDKNALNTAESIFLMYEVGEYK